jgi:hypothetical protein
MRARAFEEYGGKCVCCGETEPAFLVFDHVNDDGAAHRREIGGASVLIEWIFRENFPDTIQLLCANCNMAKQFNPGGCPHQQS